MHTQPCTHTQTHPECPHIVPSLPLCPCARTQAHTLSHAWATGGFQPSRECPWWHQELSLQTRVHPEWVWWPVVWCSLYGPCCGRFGFPVGQSKAAPPTRASYPHPCPPPPILLLGGQTDGRPPACEQAGLKPLHPPSTRTPRVDILPPLPSPGMRGMWAGSTQWAVILPASSSLVRSLWSLAQHRRGTLAS